MTSEQEAIERVPCNTCSNSTKHRLLKSVVHKGTEDVSPDFDISWTNTFDLFECCGCGDVTLRRENWHSEMNHDDQDITFYPPRVARNLPQWRHELPSEMCQLMEEIYGALHANSRRLSMMGARALMDMVILEKVGDQGTFQEKLMALESAGYVGKKNRETLEAALDVGSASSHRGHNPTPEQTTLVMDIIENVIQASILEQATEELRKSTPQRPKKKRE